MVQAIIFDCFGVLSQDIWRPFVASLPVDQQQPASEINHAYDMASITKDEFQAQIMSLTGKQADEVENVHHNIHKDVAVLDYVRQLKPHYRLGVLSNVATNWLRESLLTRDEQQLFNAIVLSFEERLAKHDPAIFRLAAQRLGVAPQDCVMIDDQQPNCDGARSAGLQAIVYQGLPQLKQQLQELLTDSKN